MTYRSASSRPANSGSKFVFPPTQEEQKIERGPAPSFKDKESYQELFKPLPKPEAIPQLVPFKVCVENFAGLSLIFYHLLGPDEIMEAASRRKGVIDELPA